MTEVESGSPAESAGLSKGDVIVKVNEMQFNAGVSHDTAAAVSILAPISYTVSVGAKFSHNYDARRSATLGLCCE